MATGTIALDGYLVAIDAERIGMPPDKIGAFFHVIVSGLKRVFWRQAILHGYHPATAVKGQLTQLIIMDGKPATDEATAMGVNHHQSALDKRGGECGNGLLACRICRVYVSGGICCVPWG